MQIIMEKGKKKKIKRDGQVIWNGGALAGLGSRRPLHWAGSDGAVPRREQPPGTGRDPAAAVGVPGEESITHLRAAGDLASGCPHGISSHIPTFGNSRFGEKSLAFGGLHIVACQGWAGGEQLLHPPLDASGLAPSTCSDSEKEVTGTCRQEPLTYIKKVYSRESVYISINISCIYINKYIKKKECIILMQHKAVLRESLEIWALQSRIYWSGQKKRFFVCLFYIFTVLF